MVNSLPVTLLVAILLGFLTGLGIGGGSLLILWLTVVLEMDQLTARGINLLFFIPAAVISCFIRLKQGAIHWKTVLPAAISGCVAAGVCSLWSYGMDLDVLKKLFGIVLLAAGMRELLYKKRTG